MKTKELPIIITNYEYKTLKITNNHTLAKSGEEITGPYLSMYNYRYKGFTWINYKTWSGESEPSLQRIQEITKKTRWEEYMYSVIVEPGMTFEEMTMICEKLHYMPDYFLLRENGSVSLLHETNYIEELIDKGYSLQENIHGEGNYSFGMGVYCLDKSFFNEFDSWPKGRNVYEGEYNGEYLRCIEDTNNGLKCGMFNKKQQEIVIPFTEKEIKWKLTK